MPVIGLTGRILTVNCPVSPRLRAGSLPAHRKGNNIIGNYLTWNSYPLGGGVSLKGKLLQKTFRRRRKRMKKRMLIATVVFLTSIVLTGMVNAKDPYVVGYQTDFTGPGSVNFSPVAEGFRVYIEALNDRGGINGHPVKVIYEDDKANPARASAVATKLILEDKVLAIAGLSYSHTHPGVYELAKKSGVPIIAPWASPAGVWDPVKYDAKLIFATGQVMHPKFNFLGYAAPQVLAKTFPKTSTVGVISYDLPAARDFTNWAIRWSEKLGYKVVYRGDIPPGTVDATSWGLKIVESKPDVLITSFGGDLLVYLFPLLEKLGWTGAILGGNFTSLESILKGMDLFQKPRDNIYMWSSTIPVMDIHVPGGEEIIKAMKKYDHKYRPWAHHVSGWVTAGVIAEALARAGWPCDRASLVNALEKTKFDTKGLMGGPIQFSPKDHSGLTYAMGFRWIPDKKVWAAITDWIKVDPYEIAKLSD